MKRWSMFEKGGLDLLLSKIAQIKQTADGLSSAVSGLGEDLANFSQATAQSVAKKQDKPQATSCTIPTTGWASDETAGYPNYYDLPVTGVTATDRVEITLAPAGINTAVQCGLCPTCESLAGKIRLRAASVPSAAIAAEYWIEQGKE